MCTVSISSPDTSYYENWPGPNPISRVCFKRNGTWGLFRGGRARKIDHYKVPLHSIFEEKRKRVGSQHWINYKTLKMQRFCPSYISKNWKFPIFFNFFKCAYTIFNNSGNINHQNGSESCPKSTKDSQTKGFPQSDTTTFRGYFHITAYVSEKQKCRRKKYRKISVTVRLVSA